MTRGLRLLAVSLLLVTGCVAPASAPGSTRPTATEGPPSPYTSPSEPAWPAIAVRDDLPAGITAASDGFTVTLRNDGAATVWPARRPDVWSGPPWRLVDEAPTDTTSGSTLGPGDRSWWNYDGRTGPRRIAIRLWPSADTTTTPWLVWADVPGGLTAAPSATSEYPWVLGVSNQTTIPVTITVNGRSVGIARPTQPFDRPRSDLPALPWTVEAHSPAGRVLVSMSVHEGDVSQSSSSNGGSGSGGPFGRVDLDCGRLDMYVGAGLSGPVPCLMFQSPASCPPAPPCLP
jgi:hypothetical protein